MSLLRPKDVASILNCSVSEVYNLKDRGKLPWCKIGGMVRVSSRGRADAHSVERH